MDDNAHVARLSVSGSIGENRQLAERLTKVAANSDTKALILAINSPGGSVTGGESLHHAISKVAEVKPVVAVMGGLAASAGYMIAMPAHHVLARESTITGSISVLLETREASGLLARLGVTTEAIMSGPLKDQPNYTRPLTDEARTALQSLVDDLFEQFVAMVAKGRKMAPDQVRALADGRAFTGRQAVALNLVDAIGGEPEARQWLLDKHGINRDLPTRDVTTGSLARRTLGISLNDVWQAFWKTLISQSVSLDGAVSVWQVPGA
jgi:protease-4